MAQEVLKEKNNSLLDDVNHFLLNWHQFIIDYWWRRKYNVPFGSPQHRRMNLLDMYIEFQEDAMINRISSNVNKDDSLDGVEKMSEKEIDDEFERLDLSQFDK